MRCGVKRAPATGRNSRGDARQIEGDTLEIPFEAGPYDGPNDRTDADGI